MANLQDFIQSLSNTAAENVSGPVDGINWLLGKAGLPIEETPILGSRWMEKKGLMRPVKQSASSLAGETVGLLSPMLVAANAGKIARGLLQARDNLAAPQRLNPQTGAIMWHGKLPKNNMDAEYLKDLISSQRHLDRSRVAAKIKNRDFDVAVTPRFMLDGQKVRAIQDGHHALEAAIRSGNMPNFIENTAQQNDRIGLLTSGKIDDFLEAAYHDSPWYNFSNKRELF